MSKPIIDINGVLREMTDAEYTAYLAGREQAQAPTLEERNRADIDYLAMMLEVEL